MIEEGIQYNAQVLIWIHSLLKNYGATGSRHMSNFSLPCPYTPLWHLLNGMRISKLHIYTFWILTWPLGLNQCFICKNVICLMAVKQFLMSRILRISKDQSTNVHIRRDVLLQLKHFSWTVCYHKLSLYHLFFDGCIVELVPWGVFTRKTWMHLFCKSFQFWRIQLWQLAVEESISLKETLLAFIN